MTLRTTPLDGLLLIEPSVFTDDRGYFFEPFNAARFQSLTGLKVEFVQDNESMSHRHTLRGLHFQVPPAEQGKLVRVTRGAVLDVAVDLRNGSPTFGQHYAVELNEVNKLQLWIPPGFAHGLLTLDDQTIFSYKCTGYYSKENDRALKWNDPDLGIDWGVNDILISEKDRNAPYFNTFVTPFEYQGEP